MGTHCIAEKRTALYRFYDDQGELLYVGITNDPWRRWRQHVLAKPWYPQVKHQAVTWYGSEPQARKAETRAIRAERPKFNIAGALKPPSRFFPGRELLVIIGVIWIAIPVACNFASHETPPLASVAMWTVCSSLVPILLALMIIGTSRIYRFGCWLHRNFDDDFRAGGTSR